MRTPLLLCAASLLAACGSQPITDSPNSITITASQFNEARFRQDIKVLSSDEFEGRAPTTSGEKKTLKYLTQSFKEMGLVGANNGEYLQAVPMVSYTTLGEPKISLGSLSLTAPTDVVIGSRHDVKHIDIKKAPLVFVGYGVNAPEYDWNDYQGLDMMGKIAVILVNDPGFARPDSGKFNGRAMTYYGRWNYKFEEASRQGAIGALIVHDTQPASYPWSVVENSWTGAQQDLANQSSNTESQKVLVEGWITLDKAKALFTNSNLNLAQLMEKAADGSMNIQLNQTADINFNNKVEYANSYNVVATLPGNVQKDEHILFLAHWDHIGLDKTKTGDQIYNGALDNASGTAGILEIARQFAELKKEGKNLNRSLTFIAATGEEQGLLGSRFYANNPLYPINKTVAVLTSIAPIFMAALRTIPHVSHLY